MIKDKTKKKKAKAPSDENNKIQEKGGVPQDKENENKHDQGMKMGG